MRRAIDVTTRRCEAYLDLGVHCARRTRVDNLPRQRKSRASKQVIGAVGCELKVDTMGESTSTHNGVCGRAMNILVRAGWEVGKSGTRETGKIGGEIDSLACGMLS